MTDQTAAERPLIFDHLDDFNAQGVIPYEVYSELHDLAHAAVAAEREACAGAVDELCDDVDDPFMYGTLRAVAAAIRSRGEATDV